MQQITVLGSTGSIGCSTLDVIKRHEQRYQVFALTAHSSVDALVKQCVEFKPQYAVISDRTRLDELQAKLSASGCGSQALAGLEGLVFVSRHEDVDTIVSAIVGSVGLFPTMAAVKSGKKILLANKESLVMAGKAFMDAVKDHNATLLPLDSEHNAIFQCLPQSYQTLHGAGVEKILLTASGGPFRSYPVDELKFVTPDQACAHPNWSMGRKISVDSASMMNKGLEFIEARWMFDAQVDQIQVVIHPQSVIHSMVQYADGSTLAQMGNPDMRTPIAHALAWPQRVQSGVKPLDLFSVARLDFEEPDFERFPCLRLAMTAAREDSTLAAVMNAANEIAVDAFLNNAIRFTEIATVVENTMSKVASPVTTDLEEIVAIDSEARVVAKSLITR